MPRHYRWNVRAFLGGYIFFMIGFAFVNVATVMPGLVRNLTDSAPVVGLVGTVFYGGWLIPQLLFARLIHGRPRRKPYIVAGVLGRPALWVIALALWGGLARSPSLMLIVFFVCLAIWAVTDALITVPWLDLLAVAIPVERRGRVLGLSQSIGGLAGIGAGALVGRILDSPALGFPDNYALIFLLGGLCLVPSSVSLILLREPDLDRLQDRGRKASMRDWLRQVLGDARFRRVMLSQVLVSLVDLATPFYVGHAADVLGLPERTIGQFVVAQTLGAVGASALLGFVSERWGPRRAAQLGSGVLVLAPALALVAHVGGGWLVPAYGLVFIALGALGGTRIIGFTNLVLEMAPDEFRQGYVGVANTVAGIVSLVPALGGALLEATSYPVLFSVAGVLALAGFLVSLGLNRGMRGIG